MAVSFGEGNTSMFACEKRGLLEALHFPVEFRKRGRWKISTFRFQALFKNFSLLGLQGQCWKKMTSNHSTWFYPLQIRGAAPMIAPHQNGDIPLHPRVQNSIHTVDGRHPNQLIW